MNADLFADLTAEMPVVASFDAAAERYRKHAIVQRAMAAWLAEWLPVERRGRALEIGAGSGLFTELLVPWNDLLLATDLSPAMCAAGRQAVPAATWTVMSADALEGSGWQWVFSSSMLQWARQPDRILAQWRERLAPGGRILAGLYIAETLPEMRLATGWAGPVQWRSMEFWRATLAQAGLVLERDSVERRVFHHSSALAFWRSLHEVGAAPSRRMPPGQLRRWLREYDLRFASALGVRATWTFYRFEAARSR